VRRNWDAAPAAWRAPNGGVTVEANQMAGLYGALGRPEEVAVVLETGYARGDTTVLAAATNPYLRNVKQHPKIQAILKRLGY
jgi:hypothetical protein